MGGQWARSLQMSLVPTCCSWSIWLYNHASHFGGVWYGQWDKPGHTSDACIIPSTLDVTNAAPKACFCLLIVFTCNAASGCLRTAVADWLENSSVLPKKKKSLIGTPKSADTQHLSGEPWFHTEYVPRAPPSPATSFPSCRISPAQ